MKKDDVMEKAKDEKISKCGERILPCIFTDSYNAPKKYFQDFYDAKMCCIIIFTQVMNEVTDEI